MTMYCVSTQRHLLLNNNISDFTFLDEATACRDENCQQPYVATDIAHTASILQTLGMQAHEQGDQLLAHTRKSSSVTSCSVSYIVEETLWDNPLWGNLLWARFTWNDDLGKEGALDDEASVSWSLTSEGRPQTLLFLAPTISVGHACLFSSIVVHQYIHVDRVLTPCQQQIHIK